MRLLLSCQILGPAGLKYLNWPPTSGAEDDACGQVDIQTTRHYFHVDETELQVVAVSRKQFSDIKRQNQARIGRLRCEEDKL